VHKATGVWRSQKFAIGVYIGVNIIFLTAFIVTLVMAIQSSSNNASLLDTIMNAHAFFVGKLQDLCDQGGNWRAIRNVEGEQSGNGVRPQLV